MHQFGSGWYEDELDVLVAATERDWRGHPGHVVPCC
jgi:hypothetical protein